MGAAAVKIVLTGSPGCGKTTAVMRVLERIGRRQVAGFYTQEIRRAGVREGFWWCRLDGARGRLAHVDIRSRFRVGKYAVDVEGFEREVVPVLDPGQRGVRLFVIDEVGKMECFSQRFVAAVRALFAGDKSVLATVAQKGDGLIAQLKRWEGVELFRLSRSGREQVIEQIIDRLSFLQDG